MHQDKITAIFDRQAASYDQQWGRIAAISEALHLLSGAVLAGLPARARILCVGAGTGSEILALAQRFPEWRFVAVEPSAAMGEVLLRRAEERGIAGRCALHAGYLDTLPPGEPFDAATAILVSQFILDRAARSQFFQGIAARLRPGGTLVSADLAGQLDGADADDLLDLWRRVMSGGDAPADPAAVERMRQAYRSDVAVLPPEQVAQIIAGGGFAPPVRFFQAGLMHAWWARRP
ncbi:class I SAM-dependent methyltransferase [Chloroflexia bacterium SDU3-3]|nr:class I SAM-dependent methyltransferase [Chloroflexia bacterium SDU3-3]